MKMELFKIGSLSVHGYGFMIGIGFIIALFLGEFRAKRKNMKDEAVIDLAIIAGVTGFIGAKILYIIVSFKEFMVNPLAVSALRALLYTEELFPEFCAAICIAG